MGIAAGYRLCCTEEITNHYCIQNAITVSTSIGDRSQYLKFSSDVLSSPQTAKNTDDTNHQPTTPEL
ncbi:hypothetical protein [Aphanizomenon sp. UHCC 0183]|uniref:hypothetical protein n=1 Tax=Aphanizomenon sp. UHCC 0183 TaxID=2590028 RepID=UPI0014457079|nr:hypothetical protein [Aphanizomenon sp. UHCC 0183]